jgi:hypothetical protein
MAMTIKIKYKDNVVKIENDHQYTSYIDVKHFVLEVIGKTIDKLKENN